MQLSYFVKKIIIVIYVGGNRVIFDFSVFNLSFVLCSCQLWILIFALSYSADCPLEVEDLNKLAQIHDPNKEDAVDYSLFISCKKFISKVSALA